LRADAANANGTNNIWRVNTDATGLMPLTTVTASMAESYLPQWSPDGAKIAFYSSRKLDGTVGAQSFGPSFSP
jgi:Tol biopolymer transport system component